MRFDLYNAERTDLFEQGKAIAQKNFILDTATPTMAFAWYLKNPFSVVAACQGNSLIGYIDFLPLTPEAQILIEERVLYEEDITADHILSMGQIHRCRAVYFPGIAVQSDNTLTSARAAAALISGAMDVINTQYKGAAIEFLYANPTTYIGNKLVRRLGFGPISFRKNKMGGMDLYMLVYNDTRRAQLHALAQRYDRFIATRSWGA